jgi:hypothetical protein
MSSQLGTFVTSSLPLAAYLAAGQHLEFREIQVTDPRRALLVFEDPQQRGKQLEKEFFRGALVNAVAFHTQLRILRRAIDEALFAANSGVNEEIQFKDRHHVSRQFISQQR